MIRPPQLHASGAWILVLVLLWAQSLGVWHGIVHGGHRVGSVHESLVLTDAAPEATNSSAGVSQSRGFFKSLFGDHATVDCQLFDQLSHGDALAPASIPALSQGLFVACIAQLTGLVVARWAALFQARAPPFSR